MDPKESLWSRVRSSMDESLKVGCLLATFIYSPYSPFFQVFIGCRSRWRNVRELFGYEGSSFRVLVHPV